MSLGFQKENIRFIQKALQADKNSYAFFSAQRLKGSLPVWALGVGGWACLRRTVQDYSAVSQNPTHASCTNEFIQKALQADKNSYAFPSAQRLKGSLPVWALGVGGWACLRRTVQDLRLPTLEPTARSVRTLYARKLYERVHSESAAGGQKQLRFSQRAATERLFARLGSHPSQEEPGAIHASARSRARNAASAVGEGTEGSRGSGRETSHRRAVAKRVGSSRG